MKRFVAVIIALGSMVAISCVAYSIYPRKSTISYTVAKMVPEQRVGKERIQIEVDGKQVEVDVPVRTEILRPVWETKTREILPTAIAWVKFGIFVGVAVFVWLYMLFVLYFWARDLTSQTRESQRVRDTRTRLDGIVGFALGITLGFIGGQYFITIPDTSRGAYHNGSIEYQSVPEYDQEIITDDKHEMMIDPGPAP